MIRNIFRSQRQEEIISLINDSLELLKSKKWPEISYQDRQVMLGLFAVIGGWYGFTRIIPGTKVQVQISNRWINASIIEDGQGKGKVSVILDDDFQLKLERVDHDKVKSLEPSLDNAISTKLNFDLLCEAITHVHQQIKGQQKESSTQKISIDDALISETVLFQMLLKVCSKLDWVNINQRSSANFTRFREILIQVTSVNVDCETHEDKTQEYLEKQLIEAWENVIDRDEQRNLSFYSPKEFNGADQNKNTIFVDLNQNYPSKSQGLVQEKLVQFSFGGSNTSSIYIDNDFVQPSSSYLKGLPEPVLKKNQKEAALKLLFYWEKYVLPTTREFVRSTFQKWEMNYYFEQLRHHLRQGDQRSAMNDAMTLWENKIPGGVILPHENTDWTAKVADECIVDSWVLAKLTSSRQTPSQKLSTSQSLSKSSKNQSQQKMPEQSVPLIIRLIDQGIQAIVIQIKLVDSRYNCVLGEFYDLENLSSHLVWFPISHLYELDYPLPPRSVGYSRKSVALSYLQSLENINQLYARKTLIKFFQSSYNQQISLENENQIAIVQKQNKVQFKWSELFGELKLHELISWSVQEEFSSSPFYGWLQDLNCALPIPVKANDKPNNTSGSTLQENQKVSDSIYLQKIIDETSDKIIIEKLLSREGSAQKEQVSKNNSQVSSSLSLIRNLLQNVVQGLTKEALTDSNEAYNTLNELTNWIYLNWMQMSQQVAQNRAVFDLCKYKENSNKKDKKDSGQTSTQNNTLIALHQVVSQNQKQISTKDDRTDQSIATLIMFHKVGCQLTPCSKVQFYSDSNQVNLVSEINAGTEAKTVLPPLVFNHGQIWANVVPGSLALLSKEQQNETSSSLPCAVFQIPKQWTVVCWLTETLSTSLLDLSTNQNQEVIVIVQEIYKKLIGAIVLFYQDSASPQIIKSQVIQLLMRLIRKLRFLYRQPSNNALNCLQTSDQSYSKLQHFTLLGITPAFIKTVLNDLDTFKKDEEKLAMASGSNYESQLLYSSFIQDAVELLMTIAVPFESCSIKNQELQIPRLNSYQDILEIKEPYLADLKKWIDPLLKTSMFMHYFNGEITSLPLDLLEEIHQQTTLGSYKAMDHILIVDKVVQDEENWPKTWIREQVISLCKKHHARVLNPNQDIIFNEGEYFVENKTEGSTLAEQTIQKCYTIIILLDGWNHMHPLPYSQNIFGDAVTEAKENKACFIDFKKIDSKSYRNFVQLFDSDSEVEEDVQDVDVEKLEREKKRAEEEAKFNAEIEALKPTEWSCETCTFMNQMTDSTCQICYQGKRPTMDKIMQEIRTQKEEERRQKKEAEQAQNLQVDGIDSGKGIQKEEVEEFDENLTRLKFLSYDLVRFIKAEQKRKISEKKENKILKEILQPANDSDWEVNEAVQPENESQESNPIRKIDDQPVSDDYHEEFEIEMMPELPELGQKEDEDPRIKKLIELGIDLSMLEQDPQLVQVILESANLAEQQAREEEQKKKEAEEENLKREKLEKEKQEIKQKQGEEIKIHYHKTEVAFGVIQIKKAKDQAIRALFSSLTLRVANQEGEFTERAKKVLRNIYENLQAINSSSKIESLGEKNKNQILFGLDGNEIESLNDYGLSYESLKTQEYEEFESCCSVLLAADILLLFKLIAAQGYDFWLQQKTMSWTALNGNSTHDDIKILDKGLIEKLKTFVEIDYCDEKKVISQLTPYQFRILSKMNEDLNIDQQEIKPIGYFDDSILAVNASKQQQHHWLNSVSQAQLSFGWALVKTFSKYFAITVPFINCSVSIADTPQRGAIPITLSAYMSSLRNLCLSNTKYELKHLILQKTSYEREKTPSLLFERLKLHANSDQLAIQMKQEKKKSQNEGSAEQQDMLLNQQQVKTAQQIEQNETKQQNKNFMFTQAYEQLKDIDLWMLRPSEPRGSAPHLSFEVFFKGEDVVGMGGPYRQFFSDVALELQMVEQAERNENEEDGGREEDNNAAANEQNEENKSNEQSRQHLGLLCQSRNMLRKSQKGKDNFTISPSKNKLNHLSLFNFLGLLMGVCIRTNTNLSINLPSLVWKQLVGQRLTSDDIEQFDDAIQSELNEILLVSSAEEFEYTFTERYFTTILSDGTEVELCENGARKLLTFQNREEFARSLIYTRLKECEVQCEAIKRGICQIIPEALLNMVSYQELEEWIYGKKEVDVLLLQRHTEYGTGFTEESKEVKWFWEILFELSMEQLRKLVLFSYAQKTIPPNDEEFDRRQVRFMIRPYQGEKEKKKQNQEQIDRRLPRADTCFFNFELPNYSSKEVMKRQILFAITFDNVSLNAEQEDMQFHPNDNQSNGGFDNY